MTHGDSPAHSPEPVGAAGTRARRARRPRPLDIVCIGAFAGQVLWGSVSPLLIPSLIGTHPVLLEVVNASAAAMVGAGAFVGVGRASFLAAVTAPLPLWLPLDAVAWWAGRRYGRAVVKIACRWRPELRGAADRGERLLTRFGFWVLLVAPWLPVPDQITFVGLGEARIPLWRFVLGDAVGVLARSLVIVSLGAALGRHAVAVTTRVSQYALMIIAAALVLATSWVVLRRRGHRRRAARHAALTGVDGLGVEESS